MSALVGLQFVVIVSGNHAACINAVTMALIDAGVPMKDFVCACNAGLIEDTPLVGELVVIIHAMVGWFYSYTV